MPIPMFRHGTPSSESDRLEQEKFWFAYNEDRDPADQIWPDWMKTNPETVLKAIYVSINAWGRNTSVDPWYLVDDAAKFGGRTPRDEIAGVRFGRYTPRMPRVFVHHVLAKHPAVETVCTRFNLAVETVLGMPTGVFAYLVERSARTADGA